MRALPIAAIQQFLRCSHLSSPQTVHLLPLPACYADHGVQPLVVINRGNSAQHLAALRNIRLLVQSSHTVGVIWTGAKGVRLSRIFMFPVKSADLPNIRPHAAWRSISARA